MLYNGNNIIIREVECLSMIIENISKVSKVVSLMDEHMRNEILITNDKVQQKKLWENTFIKHQIDKRVNGGNFETCDHIRAMVYSMVSSGIPWKRVESGIDLKTGKILPIDEIFHEYEPNFILHSNPDDLADKIKGLNCASFSTRKQMKALIYHNIPKLLRLEEEYGSVDTYYQKFIKEDNTLKTLVKTLSNPNSKDKMVQMGEALTCEYLRNVGHNIPKPDRHIRRILGSKHLACSEYEIVPVYEAFDIVSEIAKESGRSAAEVDYILWSYCAKGYGEICTSKSPKCDKCIAIDYCKKQK